MWRWLIVTLNAVAALSPVIKIGAIFSEEVRGGSAELAFKYAVYRINKERSLFPDSTLVYDIQYIPVADSFHIHTKACALIKSGCVAIFSGGGGPMATLGAVSQAMHAPHFIAAPSPDPTNDTESFTINLYPSRDLLVKAFEELTAYLNWSRMGIIYEDYGYGELNMLNLAKDGRDMYAVRCESPHEYRRALAQLKAQKVSHILVDTDPQHWRVLARAILQLQMNNEDYHYIFTSFDMELMDLEDFYYNRVNMSGWRLVDRGSERVKETLQVMEKFHPIGASILSGGHIKTEPALLYDAVQVLALALASTKDVNAANVSCEDDTPWAHGKALRENINKIESTGLTGPLEFQNGARTNFNLQLMRLVGGEDGGTVLSGTWSPAEGLIVTDPCVQKRSTAKCDPHCGYQRGE
ncbi:hypothetical protein O0L34_g12031 [Tuta absoluta]|nr:hypothetical protein O0L34_g12031 [Tuta absoluta]